MLICDLFYRLIYHKFKNHRTIIRIMTYQKQINKPTSSLYVCQPVRGKVRGKGTISIRNQTVTVTYPRRSHNPILRSVQWDQLPEVVPGMENTMLQLRFK